MKYLISHMAFSRWRSSATALASFRKAARGEAPPNAVTVASAIIPTLPVLSVVDAIGAKLPTEGHRSISMKYGDSSATVSVGSVGGRSFDSSVDFGLPVLLGFFLLPVSVVARRILYELKLGGNRQHKLAKQFIVVESSIS